MAAGLALLLPAAAIAGGETVFERRTIAINTLNIFELRTGALSNGPNAAELLALAITAHATPNTTTLTGAAMSGDSVFDPLTPAPAFATLDTGALFSLGGGCARGAQVDFPYIKNLRPRITRRVGGQFSKIDPPIGGSDQYDSIDCAPAPDAGSTFFALSNRTLSRVEVYRDGPGGFLPVNTTSLTGAITAFGGGLRTSLSMRRIGGIAHPLVAYTHSSGNTRTATLNGDTGALAGVCDVFFAPAPTGFTRPREAVFLSFKYAGMPRHLLIGDLDNNGSTETTAWGSTCAPVSTPTGSSAGGGIYNWTGYGGASDPDTDYQNVLWGDYFYVEPQNGFAFESDSPFAGRGGPFDACGARYGDGSYRIIGIGTAATPSQAELVRFVPQPRLFSGGFEPRVLQDCRRRYFSVMR